MTIINNQIVTATDQDCMWSGTDEDINGFGGENEVGTDATAGRLGFRFPLTIPQGATINACRLGVHLVARSGSFTAADTVKVRTWASDTVAGFDDTHAHAASGHDAGGLSATEVTGWSNLATEALFADYESPDLSTLLQEVVNRAGWASGNYFGLYVEPDGLGASKLIAVADFEYGPVDTEAYIYVDYTAVEGPTPPAGAATLAGVAGRWDLGVVVPTELT